MAAITTSTSAKAWAPDVQEIVADDAVPEALVLRCATVAGQIEGDAVAMRVPWVDDADATIVPEGTTIAEADPDLSEATVFTVKVAQLLRLSFEQWSQPNAARLLSDSVSRAVTRKADQAFVAQPAPTAPAVSPPAGLVTWPGVVSRFTVAGNLDALVLLQSQLADNGAVPTNILLSPSAWASLQSLKAFTADAGGGPTSNVPLLGAGTQATDLALLGVPVIVSSAVPAGQGIMLDSTSIVAAVGPVRVAQSEDVYFAADSVGLRATWRIGWSVMRPDRLGVFEVTTP